MNMTEIGVGSVGKGPWDSTLTISYSCPRGYSFSLTSVCWGSSLASEPSQEAATARG